MIETRWTLDVEMLSEHNGFTNVIDNVHWRVHANDTDTGATTSIYGSQSVPKPTNHASYIDITTMLDLTAEERRVLILGWAEAIEPGFIEEKEAQARATLEEMNAAPARTVLALL